MKRFALPLVIVAALATFAIWYRLSPGSAKSSSTAVTSLLPKETLFLVHFPDLNRTRADFHKTDLYKIWREPAVQEFLQKPRTRMPRTSEVGQRLEEMRLLEMKDAFVAVTEWDQKEVKVAGGFRFKGTPEDAEKIVGKWRSQMLTNVPDAKHEAITYQQHSIQMVSKEGKVLATVYARDWFLAANDILVLQQLLDRLSKGEGGESETLTHHELLATAFKQMPPRYEVLLYGRLDRYFENMFSKENAPDEHVALLRQTRSLCGAMAFDGGKIRDVVHVGMPKIEAGAKLSRKSLALATPETFLYAASLINFAKLIPLADAKSSSASMPAALQHLVTTLSSSGVTLELWNAAFGSEAGVIGDWPARSRLPSVFATLPVKDFGKANQIVDALTTEGGKDSKWTQREKEGTRYYSMASFGQFFAFSPTIAVSPTVLVAGAEAGSVEAAVGRNRDGRGELAGSRAFRNAERTVPDPEQAFTYVDAALFYTRLDAAVRPLLLMSAAFVPGIGENVDLGKLPAPEVITKHLGPIVLSQTYRGQGYLTESAGPVTMNHAILGLGAVMGGAAAAYRNQFSQGSKVTPQMSLGPPATSPSPIPAPTP